MDDTLFICLADCFSALAASKAASHQLKLIDPKLCTFILMNSKPQWNENYRGFMVWNKGTLSVH